MHDVALLDYFKSWDPVFRARYVPEWPRTYLCVDTEYDSSDKEKGLIWEIGHVLVQDGVVVNRANFVLDWYRTGKFESHYLDDRLADIARKVGFDWRLTPQVVQQEGDDAVKILRFYRKLFDTWMRSDSAFVMQNGQQADEILFASNFRRFLSSDFVFPESTYFDTGCMFKAFRAWSEPKDFGNYQMQFKPTSFDTPKSYFRRVSSAKVRGLFWKLGLLVDTFSLLEKHGSGPTNFHNALYDAECLHWAMTEFGRVYDMLGRLEKKPAPSLSVDTVANIVNEELAGPPLRGYAPGHPPVAPVRQRNI